MVHVHLSSFSSISTPLTPSPIISWSSSLFQKIYLSTGSLLPSGILFPSKLKYSMNCPRACGPARVTLLSESLGQSQEHLQNTLSISHAQCSPTKFPYGVANGHVTLVKPNTASFISLFNHSLFFLLSVHFVSLFIHFLFLSSTFCLVHYMYYLSSYFLYKTLTNIVSTILCLF